MNLPEIAIINFSSESDRDVQRAVRAVNRQVIEDFMPTWGSGYVCQLLDSAWGRAAEDVLAEDPIQAAGVIYELGNLDFTMGDYSAAIVKLERARRILTANPDVPKTQLASVLNSLAASFQRLGD